MKPIRRKISNKTAVIDADSVVYNVCHEALVEERMGKDEWTWSLNEKDALKALGDRANSLRSEAGCSSFLLCFSDSRGRYWRHDVEPSYKGNRVGRRKPLGFEKLVTAAMEMFPSKRVPRFEADDLLGLFATDPDRPLGEIVMVSNDKDLLGVPGMLYDYKNVGVVITTSKERADLLWCVRAIAGDVGDGYKGVEGLGEVTAMKELEPRIAKGMKPWDACISVFAEHGYSRADAVRQMMLARVLRHEDLNPWIGSKEHWLSVLARSSTVRSKTSVHRVVGPSSRTGSRT